MNLSDIFSFFFFSFFYCCSLCSFHHEDFPPDVGATTDLLDLTTVYDNISDLSSLFEPDMSLLL